MQPLKTRVRPCCSSTIGWAAASERSITLRRRWASATHPSAHEPWPSGPRGASRSAICSTVPRSAARPSYRTSPAMPHMGAPPGSSGDLAWSRSTAGTRAPERHTRDVEPPPSRLWLPAMGTDVRPSAVPGVHGGVEVAMVVERATERTNGLATSAVPTFGVEEEYLLLHPASGIPVPLAAVVLDEALSRACPGDPQLQPELVRCQLELATPVSSTVP